MGRGAVKEGKGLQRKWSEELDGSHHLPYPPEWYDFRVVFVKWSILNRIECPFKCLKLIICLCKNHLCWTSQNTNISPGSPGISSLFDDEPKPCCLCVVLWWSYSSSAVAQLRSNMKKKNAFPGLASRFADFRSSCTTFQYPPVLFLDFLSIPLHIHLLGSLSIIN